MMTSWARGASANGNSWPMTDWMIEDAGLAGLFVASFVAATIVPLSSEVVLFGYLKLHPQAQTSAIALAVSATLAM